MQKADLNSQNPFAHALLATFAVHDPRTTTTSQQRVAAVLVGRLAKVCNLFARGDVVGADQGVEQRHLSGLEVIWTRDSFDERALHMSPTKAGRRT